MIGQRIGPYEVLEKLGEGGIGVVYKARDTRLGRLVALKLLREYYAEDAEAMERFAREARTASALNHPNVCTVYEIERDARGRPCLVLELLEGETLAERLRAGALPLPEALRIGRELLLVLEALHGVGIVHRDLKPGNVFLTRSGGVKVLDFGLAKFVIGEERESDRFETRPGLGLGTLAYMSPEQAWGDEGVDGRSDLFSLGALLYETATGRRAFAAPTPALVFDALMSRQPTSARVLNPALPRALETLLSRALEKEREARYASAAEMLAALEQVRLAVTRPTATVPEGALATLPALARSRRALAAGAGLVALAALVAGWLLSRARPGYDSVAVLPFAAADAETEYLGDGVAETLIGTLSRLEGVRVVPRSVAFRYRGREAEVGAIARELKVKAIVTGRVSQRGDALGVSVELIDAASESQVGGERLTGATGELFSLQETLAQALSERLRPALSGAERERLRRRSTQDGRAYRLYLQGRYQWSRRSEEAIRRSIESFEQALRLDPGFSLAHAGLADAWVALSAAPPLETRPRAKAAALEALRLDDSLAEAHTALAMIRFVYDWDFPGAERSFRRALELNPEHPTAHHWFGLYLMSMGRYGEARAELGRALELDPVSTIVATNQARVEMVAHNQRQALARLERVRLADPDFFLAHGFASLILAREGRLEEALAAARRAEQNDGGPDSRAWTGYVLAAMGRRQEALEAVRAMQERGRAEYLPPFRVALVFAALGEREAAFDWLERAYRDRSPWLAYLGPDPTLDPLRGDPRFDDLLRRVGLAQFARGRGR